MRKRKNNGADEGTGNPPVDRRGFLKSAVAAGGGLLVLPSGVLGANDKLNIALIGTGGRARAHFGAASGENVVALCDIDERHLASAAKRFSKAQKYVDWRKCLDQKDINAVICSTTDHTHAFVANWAMNRDMHVYCEKPLGNSVEEARVVRATYLKKKNKLATQVGTQRHSRPNFNRVRELVLDGAIGELKAAWAWGNRQIRRKGYLPKKGEPPEHLHYDLWIGPSPWHPYNPGYFGGCLSWNMYWDFGSGQVGDMGSHTMDLAWNALDADLPTTAEGEGEKFNPEVTPVELHSSWDIPANDWRPAIKLHWYQGGMMPRSPRGYVQLKKIGHGAMFKGDHGFIVADFGSRIVIPFGSDDDMTYYKPRTEDKVLPPMGSFQGQWVKACKTDLKTSCNFDYGGKLIETMLLGLVAYRVGKKIKYDGKTGQTDDPKANQLISREYREGWTLNG
ncbi:MAG: Gfo/Idh/MocA family oxidoreductase [Candidatus Brocadiia bacterium]